MPTALPATVMIINDDALQLRRAAAWLRQDGWRVLPCQSAMEALCVLRQGAIVEAIITALHMPCIDGWHLCRLLRSPEYITCNDIPILLLSTTSAEVEIGPMRLDLGATALLPRPDDPATWRACVRDLLTGRVSREPGHILEALAAEQAILDHRSLWERVAGDPDLLREIVALFLADCPERRLELRAALVRQDAAALVRAAHRFKGALGNISATSALPAVQQVETAARAGDLDIAATALARLEHELARLTPLLTVCLAAPRATLSTAPA